MDFFESLVDRRIRDATKRGEFDDLPGAGRPLPGRGRLDGPGWWIRSFLERERARGAASRGWERVERAIGATWALRSEAAVRRHVTAVNELITAINEALDPADRREIVDGDAIVDAWRRMHRARRPR